MNTVVENCSSDEISSKKNLSFVPSFLTNLRISETLAWAASWLPIVMSKV